MSQEDIKLASDFDGSAEFTHYLQNPKHLPETIRNGVRPETSLVHSLASMAGGAQVADLIGTHVCRALCEALKTEVSKALWTDTWDPLSASQ